MVQQQSPVEPPVITAVGPENTDEPSTVNRPENGRSYTNNLITAIFVTSEHQHYFHTHVMLFLIVIVSFTLVNR